MSDLDEMAYRMCEDLRSEGDEDERLEELYNDAKTELNADARSRRFDDLFSLESAMQRKTTWGFKAAKRLLKSALEESNLEAITARYRQLLLYANSVTTNDFHRSILKIVNLLTSLSKTEILRGLFSISITDLTSASARAAIKLAQSLVRLQQNGTSLCCLTDLQHRLEGTNDVSTMTKNRCLLELHVLEMELFWRMQRFEKMDVVYCKALSLEESVVELQHMSSAQGYYGRYLLRSDKPADALHYLAKAVEDKVTSICDEHHTACVQSLALLAYTSANNNADELLDGYSGRLDVAAIRRFAMAFCSEDVDGLERILAEIEGSVNDRELRRLLRHYETVLKRKLCLRTSPLTVERWSDILQCLTHPVWHELQTVCKEFGPVLAPLLNDLHSDVQKARFTRLFGVVGRWRIALYAKSRRATKLLDYNCVPRDALLASAMLRDVAVVEIVDVNAVTNDGIVRFCFGGDGRRLEISQPMITRGLVDRLVEEHSSAANDHEFALTVTCTSDIDSDVRRQSTAAYTQHLVEKTDSSASYEIPSDTTVLTIRFAYALGALDTMTVIRKRSIV